MTKLSRRRALHWPSRLARGLVLAGATALAARAAEAGPGAALAAAVDRTYLYAEAPAWQAARQDLTVSSAADGEGFYARARTILDHVGDPDLHLLSREQFAAMTSEVKGATPRAGLIDFSLDRDPASGRPRVVTPLVGSPAAAAGLRPGDVLTRIGGASTRSLDHEQAMDLMRAQSPVVQMRRGGRTFAVRLKANLGPVQPVTARLAARDRGDAYGYVRIVQFTPGSADAFRAAVRAFEVQGARGYVVDLRNNPGGLIDEAVTAAGVFASGPLGRLVRRDGSSEPLRSDAAPLTAKPLVILVNGGTASAAEFMAGALHDTGRAAVVGERSYGRGQAQTYVALTDGYGLVIPSALLETTAGRRFKDAGLVPDIATPGGTLPMARLMTPLDPAWEAALSRLEQLRDS